MKNILLVLVMLVSTVTAYNQTSRRTTSANSTTTRSREARNTTYASNRTTERQATSVNSRTHSNTNNRQSHSVSRTTNSRNVRASQNRNHSYKVYRTVNYTYHAPVKVDLIWTANMHHHYIKMYPRHRRWHYSYGHHISSIPAYNADFYIGDVKKVYGRVTDVYYAQETDEYFLYIGPYFPYQHFTIVVPGHIARNHSHRPGRYYMNQNINVTGLITTFKDTPEILVKRNYQLSVY